MENLLQNRYKIAQIIAAAATGITVLGFIINFAFFESDVLATIGGALIVAGIFAGLVSYIIGGLFTAIKMAFGIAKWGFIVVPFPINLVAGCSTFLLAIMVFILLPIIPVRKAYTENLYK